MKVNKNSLDYQQGYFDALDKVAARIEWYEKQHHKTGDRSIPELKVFKEILSAIFFFKIDACKEKP
jgi:hypothetical protein